MEGHRCKKRVFLFLDNAELCRKTLRRRPIGRLRMWHDIVVAVRRRHRVGVSSQRIDSHSALVYCDGS
jgi:hypothetical protein